VTALVIPGTVRLAAGFTDVVGLGIWSTLPLLQLARMNAADTPAETPAAYFKFRFCICVASFEWVADFVPD
jgi:hypothetical protein